MGWLLFSQDERSNTWSSTYLLFRYMQCFISSETELHRRVREGKLDNAFDDAHVTGTDFLEINVFYENILKDMQAQHILGFLTNLFRIFLSG
jgi:hypothetical protein